MVREFRSAEPQATNTATPSVAVGQPPFRVGSAANRPSLAAAGRADSAEKGAWPSNHDFKKLERAITKTKAYATSFELTLKTDGFHSQARVDS